LTRFSASVIVLTYLSFHDALDGYFPISFLVFHSNSAIVSLPKFRMQCSSFSSQATAQLFITSYQHHFLSRPDIFLSNIFTHLKYALIFPETNIRSIPTLKSSPIAGLEWPRGFQKVKLPRFHDNGTGLW